MDTKTNKNLNTKKVKKSDTRPRAIARYVRISPTKVRIVINRVRGLPVNNALDILKFMPKSAGRIVFKLVSSAVANAENNVGYSRDDLFISEIYADTASVMKRVIPKARGRSSRIIKRMSHITVKLDVMMKEAK